ncbi:hypothetical protein L208DRAFT_1236749, partial [Tricholoma matsutake]
KVHELIEPMPLQLGTVGSQSKINFGLFAEFELRTVKADHYFDVINLDRYDAIMGTVFMRKYGLILDFEQDQVWFQGQVIPTIVESKSTFRQVHQYAMRTQPDIPRLWEEWLEICKDILKGVPKRPPPMREINHQIPLVDEKKRYNYHLPKCPDSMRQPLANKIERYCQAGWWRPAHMEQAAPMLVVPKKNGDIRTVVNAKKRNDNTKT